MSWKPQAKPVTSKGDRPVTKVNKENKTAAKQHPVTRTPTSRPNTHDRIWKIMKM
ncbi:GL23492 [Drosophila persimilis]|uniref:GL23492 n=1 Tax=Drosophila persimilis TaxID=7234 RepID=B4G358_DROPE|nr:GL23492 [Drosophila persimilis]